MGYGYTIQRGACRCTDFSFEDRCTAIKQLISPEEVQHLWYPWVPTSPSSSPPNAPIEVARFLQQSFAEGRLRYIDDPAHCDAWCSPAVTLERGGGDCDDLAILAASLLEAAGLVSWVVTGFVQTEDGPAGHAWVEGHDEDGRGYLLEATTGDIYLGRPDPYDARMAANRSACKRIKRLQKPTSSWIPLLVTAAAGAVGLALLSSSRRTG